MLSAKFGEVTCGWYSVLNRLANGLPAADVILPFNWQLCNKRWRAPALENNINGLGGAFRSVSVIDLWEAYQRFAL